MRKISIYNPTEQRKEVIVYQLHECVFLSGLLEADLNAWIDFNDSVVDRIDSILGVKLETCQSLNIDVAITRHHIVKMCGKT